MAHLILNNDLGLKAYKTRKKGKRHGLTVHQQVAYLQMQMNCLCGTHTSAELTLKLNVKKYLIEC